MGIGKQHAARRQSVDIRRMHPAAPAETVSPIVQIVDGNEQHVGFSLARLPQRRTTNNKQGGENGGQSDRP